MELHITPRIVEISADFSNCEAGRIARCLATAQTREAIYGKIKNLIGCEAVGGSNLGKAPGGPSHSHIPGFGGFTRKSPMGAN